MPPHEPVAQLTTSASMWWPLLWTLLIIALILGLAWWFKHMGFLASGRLFEGRLKLHARCALGPREQLVVVQVDDRCLLLGVTAHTIQLLDRFDPPSAIASTGLPSELSSSSTTFATLLHRFKYPLKQPNATPPPPEQPTEKTSV
ncbi:MAG: flagellar biosynthetic protein FliO [Pseudomonadota bacterium]